MIGGLRVGRDSVVMTCEVEVRGIFPRTRQSLTGLVGSPNSCFSLLQDRANFDEQHDGLHWLLMLEVAS